MCAAGGDKIYIKVQMGEWVCSGTLIFRKNNETGNKFTNNKFNNNILLLRFMYVNLAEQQSKI